MKAKYKLGMMIEVDTGETANVGIVTGIVQTEEGYFYRLNTTETEFSEKDVRTAYRQISARKIKKNAKSNGETTIQKIRRTKNTETTTEMN